MLVDAEILRRNRVSSLKLAAFAAAAPAVVAGFSADRPAVAAGWAALAAAVFAVCYATFTRKTRRRARILAKPFPQAWARLLEDHVAYYRCLDPAARTRFCRLVQVFLAEVPVSGVGVAVTDLHRVLVAASAVIPIMGLPHWDYAYLSEVLLYPADFSADYRTEGGGDRNILGMVHGALQNGVVIFSEPALVAGFADPDDRRNVGIHEFAHMVDKRDGSIDGVAGALPAHLLAPWRALMAEKMAERGSGRGSIDPYGTTNTQEFLAVTTEYFFEDPQRLREEHPRVYDMLSAVYRQDPATLLRENYRLLRRKNLGRNDPCPCGSGEKYKACCLRRKNRGTA